MTHRRWITILVGAVLLASTAITAFVFGASRSPGDVYFPGEVVIPSVISYQGYLTDPTTGEPVADGEYQMIFRLYDHPVMGILMWQEHQSVPVSGGLFNVLLGKGSPFTGNEFGGSARWLEVQLGDEVMLPRQQLAAVPYAFQARNAGRLQGKSPGDLSSRISFTGKQTIVLSNYPGFKPLAQVMIGVTGPGTIVVEATGTILIQGPGTYADLGVSGNTNSVEWVNRAGVPSKGADGDYSWPFAVSHVFEVTGQPSNWYTYYLNGRSFGNSNSAIVELGSFSAVYIPSSTPAALPAASIIVQGVRAQLLPFNVSQGNLQMPGGIVTTGTKAANATGPLNPFVPVPSYRSLSSPKPGTPPYAARGTQHTGFNGLAEVAPQNIAWDFQGAQLVETNIQNITAEGPIPLSDPRLKRTDNLVFFKNGDAGGRNSEKRTYAGGTFNLWNTATNTIIATGTCDYITVILDWSGANQHLGWGQMTVNGPVESVFYDELVRVFGDNRLTMEFGSVQIPAGTDSPSGTPDSEMYVVFSFYMTLKPIGQ